jgi:GT2 family glycosyltransferase
MTPAPTLSVIMPALNAAGRLREALASLAGEDGDIETVLVDGGSTDETIAIAAARPGLRVIRAPGSSIYEALNRGIAATRASAIVFLNTDDMVLPGALPAWRDALARAPSSGIARGRATFVEIDAAGSVVPMPRADARAAEPLGIHLILRGPCAINGLCVRRTVFDRIGTFDTRYRLAADRDWMLRAWRAGIGVAEIDRPVYRYLSHAGSSTIDRARRNYAEIRREHIDIAARTLADVGTKDRALARALRGWHAAEVGMLSWHLAKAREFRALAAIAPGATRRDAWWPVIAAGETVDWLWRQRRS